jgi:hexosaminidase
MKTFKRTMLAAATLSLYGWLGSSVALADQTLVDKMSQQIKINYAIVDNHAGANGLNCAALGADWGVCTKLNVTLENSGGALNGKDWAVYFSSIRRILQVENAQFKVTHITGDLHKLEPTEQFKGFSANQRVEVPMVAEYWQLFESDFMPRWYVTSSNAQPKIIANTNTNDVTQFSSAISGEQWKRTKEDKNVLMTAQTRYDKNQEIATLSQAALRGQIIPTPLKVNVGNEDVNLTKGVQLNLQDLSPTQVTALKSRFEALSVPIGSGFAISGRIDATQFKDKLAVSGAYRLKIDQKGASITAFDEAGIFYGVQSILSLVPAKGEKVIATLEAEDAPRFAYRGMMLDVGRHFHAKSAVLTLLDQMAAYKMNKFHFHLSDDEGWRIEIPGLPELTDIGSKRCHDLTETKCLLPQLGSGPNANNNGSGYFSKADYIEIVRYAQARNIEVIPEIDTPAHMRAAVVSMEARYQKLSKAGKMAEANEYRLLDPTDTSNLTSVQFYDKKTSLNPCLPASEKFVDKVMTEIIAMHKTAGQPLQTWHFGGDESKNIFLGGGYEDINAKEKATGKGLVDKSKEDKPWAKSAVCQAFVKEGKVADFEHLPSHFAVKVSELAAKNGIITMQAWQDGLKDAKDSTAFKTKKTAVNFWDTLYWGGYESINDWRNKGYDVIVSSPDYVYFDFPYEVNPKETGYYWGTRFNDERKIFGFAPDNAPQNAETSVDRDGNYFETKSDKVWLGATGLSGQSWSEAVRTDEKMEYMIYPRLIPLAERAWHRAAWELDYTKGRRFKGGETQFVDKALLNQDWARFAHVLGQRELAKLDQAKIEYRLPIPGARLEQGTLKANVALTGLQIQYSLDQGKNWVAYEASAAPQVSPTVKKVLLRTVSPDGQRYSREESLVP